MLVIKNGRVIDPVNNVDEVMDVVVDGDEIVKTGKNLGVDELGSDARVIDATGLVVSPGLVDSHVHFRDPGFTYKEDIYSGAKAAAKGGVTTVILMANTKPPVDNPETLKYVLDKGAETDINILTTVNVTKGMRGKEIVDMEDLASKGAAGFTDDGIPIMDEAVLLEAMKRAKALNLPVALHEEDPLFVKQAGVNMGKVSEELGYGGASHTAEDIMVARDCVLAMESGARVCMQHLSSKVSVEILRTFKKLGADVHGEATPHHFTLTEDAVLEYGTYARMNPPLRTQEDKEEIIKGIVDGTIDMIVTDHAPHSKEEKDRPMANAPSGITGIETSLALGIKSLVQPGHISLMKLIELMSANPLKFYNIEPEKIQAGQKADLVIFGENEEWVVKDYASKAVNSPFTGWRLPGKIHYTICKGKIVYENR
ncbi:MAG: dihydroorotase [Lachnospiraceae bacterium]|nr:dihydroorotase [Lachnospiraceae bacterium]